MGTGDAHWQRQAIERSVLCWGNAVPGFCWEYLSHWRSCFDRAILKPRTTWWGEFREMTLRKEHRHKGCQSSVFGLQSLSFIFLSEMRLTEIKDEMVQKWAEWDNRTCVTLPVALVVGNSLQQQLTGTFIVILHWWGGGGAGWPLSCSLPFDSLCLRKVTWPFGVGCWNLWNM